MKRRIRSKHKKYIKWSIGTLVFLSLLIVCGLLIKDYNIDKQNNEKLLAQAENNSFTQRLDLVEELNQVYDYSKNAYEKLRDGEAINTLIIGNSQVSLNQRYELQPRWQNSFELSLNVMNNIENGYSNILLRGSSLMWGYLQSESDLSNRDYDLAIIEISKEDIQQLSSDEFLLYYEALIRTLVSQFEDIQVFIVYNNEIIKSMDTIQAQAYQEIKTFSKLINEKYTVRVIEVEESNQITNSILESIDNTIKTNQTDLSDQLLRRKESLMLQTKALFNIEQVKTNIGPIDVKGFLLNKGILFNNSSSNYIEYETEASIIFINYISFEDGGTIEVYINGDLYKSVNSYNQVTGVGVIALPVTTGSKKIMIKAKDEAGSGKYIMINNLLIGE